jgi:hypothetical protein
VNIEYLKEETVFSVTEENIWRDNGRIISLTQSDIQVEPINRQEAEVQSVQRVWQRYVCTSNCDMQSRSLSKQFACSVRRNNSNAWLGLAALYITALQQKETELNSVALVRMRPIPTERQPLVGEVGANFCW